MRIMTIRLRSPFLGLSHSLKIACHSNVEFALSSTGESSLKSEVGDVALGKANVDSKNHSGKSRAKKGRCALPGRSGVPLNLVMPLSILTWNVI